MARKKEILFCDYFENWIETYKVGAVEEVTFLAMNVETLAHKLDITTDELLEIIKQNIEVEPMEFD